MRRILITPAIEKLALKYAWGMARGLHLAGKPRESLNELRLKLLLSSTTIRFSKKQPNPHGRSKKIFKGSELPVFANYVAHIISRYSTVNNLHPRDYESLVTEMEGILSPESLKAVVRIGKGIPMTFANHIVKAMDYEGVRDKVFRSYIAHPSINIRSCVYCNSQFALTTVLEPAVTPADIRKIKHRGRKPSPRPAILGATYDLDHNMPKATYPYLCTNFYNLQPCCPSCNRRKNNNTVPFNIYYWDAEDPKPLRFELSAMDITDFFVKHRTEGIVPLLKDNTEDGSIVKAFNKAFAVDKIYECHSDLVQELLWRYQIYSESDVDALRAQYSKLFSEGIDIDRFILGTYADERDAHKRPLTILLQDIFKQLKDEGGKRK